MDRGGGWTGNSPPASTFTGISALPLLRESPRRGLGAGLCHQDTPAVPAESDAASPEGRSHRHHGLGQNLGSQEEKLWVSCPQRPS